MENIHGALFRATSAALDAAQQAHTAAQAVMLQRTHTPKKPKPVALSDKQTALRMLGLHRNGTREAPLMNEETQNPWTQKDIAAKFGVVKRSVT